MAWASPADSLFNFFFRNVDEYVYHTKTLEKLSPTTRNKLLSAYQDSISLPPVKTSEHLKTYLKARSAGLPGEVPEAVVPAITGLEASLGSLDQSLADIGGRFHPSDLNTYLQDERKKALDIINAQHEADTAALKNAPLGGSIPDEPARVRALSNLAAAQKQNIDAFQKAMDDDITALHKAAQKERDRITALAPLRHERDDMRKIMDAIHLNKDDGERAVATMTGTGGLLAGVEIDDLLQATQNRIKTITGAEFQVTKTPPDGYSMQFNAPSRLFSPSFYSGASHQSKTTWLTMASFMKALGKESLTLSFNYSANPTLAMRMVREQFAAAREMGYPEDKLTMMVNGKKYTVEELFKDAPNTKQEIDLKAQHALEKQVGPDQAAMKQKMDAHRKVIESTPAVAATSTSTMSRGGS
jgi:hypothetical protein